MDNFTKNINKIVSEKQIIALSQYIVLKEMLSSLREVRECNCIEKFELASFNLREVQMDHQGSYLKYMQTDFDNLLRSIIYVKNEFKRNKKGICNLQFFYGLQRSFLLAFCNKFKKIAIQDLYELYQENIVKNIVSVNLNDKYKKLFMIKYFYYMLIIFMNKGFFTQGTSKFQLNKNIFGKGTK